MDLVHPIATTLLLATASYLVARRFFGEEAAGVAAIVAAVGRSAVTFIAGGFQANALALPLAIAMLLARPGSPELLAAACTVALIHPWTFAMYSAGYLAAHCRALLKNLRRGLTTVLFFAIALLLSELVGRFLGGASPTEATTVTVHRSLGLYFPQNLFRGVELWTWGSQASAPIFMAASLAPPSPLWGVAAVASPLILASSSVIVHRLVLNLPLEVMAAATVCRARRELLALFLAASLARSLVVLTGLSPRYTYHSVLGAMLEVGRG